MVSYYDPTAWGVGRFWGDVGDESVKSRFLRPATNDQHASEAVATSACQSRCLVFDMSHRSVGLSVGVAAGVSEITHLRQFDSQRSCHESLFGVAVSCASTESVADYSGPLGDCDKWIDPNCVNPCCKAVSEVAGGARRSLEFHDPVPTLDSHPHEFGSTARRLRVDVAAARRIVKHHIGPSLQERKTSVSSTRPVVHSQKFAGAKLQTAHEPECTATANQRFVVEKFVPGDKVPTRRRKASVSVPAVGSLSAVTKEGVARKNAPDPFSDADPWAHCNVGFSIAQTSAGSSYRDLSADEKRTCD